MMFLVLGAVSAADSVNVSNTEDSNLNDDNVDTLSVQNKLEISNEDSISQTNIVNSHDDNRGNYSDEVIKIDSDNEDIYSTSDVKAVNDTLSVSNSSSDSVLTVYSSESIVSADSKKLSSTEPATSKSTKLTVSNTYYGNPFKVTLKDSSGKALAKQKVTFKINKKSYSAYTDAKGIASIKTGLKVGTYDVVIQYGGNSEYNATSLSKKVKILKIRTNFNPKKKFYVHTNKKGSFNVILKSADGLKLKNKVVTFSYKGKKVTVRTNENGKASLIIPVLSKGTYKLNYNYKGSDNYYSTSGNTSFVVCNPITKLTAKKIRVATYKDGSKYYVKLKDANGKPLANKDVKIKIVNGTTAICKTNSFGNAKLSLNNLKPGYYLVKYSYLDNEHRNFSSGSNRLVIVKLNVKVSAKDLTMKHKDGSVYKVTVKDKSGNPLKGVYVQSNIGSKSYLYQTGSNGVAQLKITQNVGSYAIKTFVCDPCYKSSVVSKQLTVKGTKFVADAAYGAPGKSITYSVKLVNEKNKAVSGKNVVFDFNNKKTTVKTDANGIAKIKLGVLSQGTHNIKFTQDTASGSSKIFVISKVSINQIITASKNVKSYISKNGKLPASVKIGDASLKTADYLYLASKAIVNLKAGNTKNIPIKVLNNPTSPKDASDLGYLKNYLSVANSIVKTSESKGTLPNSVSSAVGTIGYNGIVYAFSKVLVSYGNNKKMPSYVSVKSLSGSSSSISGALNVKNTYTSLAAFLSASTHCEVNNDLIKSTAAKLTKNCKTELSKATAIFNYVRDTVAYSFYYNTRHGAVGTLKAKSGNCVDHAHLCVALFRAAGLPARYVHATCTFSSGHVYGHVFAQVLIGNTWTVADATSSRNSLGKVANWNTNTYSCHGHFSSISF